MALPSDSPGVCTSLPNNLDNHGTHHDTSHEMNHDTNHDTNHENNHDTNHGTDPSSMNQTSRRKRFHSDQLTVLISEFEKNHTPSFEIRESLSKQLGMTNREVQVWFQNRRAKANRMKTNPTRRFMYYPSMNIDDNTNHHTSPPLHINPDAHNFHFVPVVLGQNEFSKDLFPNPTRKIAPAPIKITSNHYTVPSYISTFRRGHHRHYSYQGVPLGFDSDSRTGNLPPASPITPDLPTPTSDISFRVQPEMVKVKPKSFSTTTLPSLKELGLEKYQLPQVGPSKPTSYSR